METDKGDIDPFALMASEYVYLSDRIVGDLHDQLEAAKTAGLKSGEASARLGFLSVNSVARDLGINRYVLATEVTESIGSFTGTLAYPKYFIKFIGQVTWYDLFIEKGRYRVAWIVAEQRGDEGHYLVCLCGSLDNYIGYESDGKPRGGWRPSSVKGLVNIVASCCQRRRFKDTPPRNEDEAHEIAIEAAHISMSLQDRDDSQPVGTGRMEILARVYLGLRAGEPRGIRLRRFITSAVDEFDAIYVGAPLWLRTIPQPAQSARLNQHGGFIVIESR